MERVFLCISGKATNNEKFTWTQILCEINKFIIDYQSPFGVWMMMMKWRSTSTRVSSAQQLGQLKRRE